MVFRAPFQLLRDGQPFGTVVSYGYETPWATGRVVAHDPAALAQGEAIAAFLAWADALPDALPDAEADARYERECAARGLTAAAIDRWTAAAWTLIDPEGNHHPAYSLSCLGDEFVQWRW
ncbi:MAG: hypothetical protein U0232_12205 [Thermomicrobiales bacterium]